MPYARQAKEGELIWGGGVSDEEVEWVMSVDDYRIEHEIGCPMLSPLPNAICNCGNPKALKWDEAQGVFRSPFYDRCALVDNATPQEIDQ